MWFTYSILPLSQNLSLSGRKVLVFVQFTLHVEYLSTLLSEHGISALRLAGELSTSMDALRRFPDPAEPNVLLLSFERHAAGINLQFCRHVVIVHPFCPPEASDAAFVSVSALHAYEKQAVGHYGHIFPTGASAPKR